MPHRWLVGHPRARALFPPIRGLRPLLGAEGLRESLASAVPSLLLTSYFSVEPRELNVGVICHSGDRSERSTRSLRDSPLIRTSSQPRARTPLLGSASTLGTVGRRGAESRGVSLVCVSIGCGGDPSAPREPSRPRAARATCPPRSAARAVVAVPTPLPPPLFSQPRSPAARRPPQPLSISCERALF